ncbi:MAG: molybdenum cofactor biosynthesis protein MoaE [Actinomycetia bacterium]|nr:molybdenum cofactor biosynthesis protein MoaE [Actinomycetes bacterium]
MEHYRIQPEPIDVASYLPWLEDPACGGQAVFVGVVRAEFEGRPSVGLEYDAYVPLAERTMAAIGGELRREFGVRHVVMVHRVGRLRVGEAAVLVAVAAPHRAEAFAACRAGIDRLKARVPIFKRELWADGTSAWHGEPGGPPAEVPRP